MKSQPNKKKFCQVGSHWCDSLFHAATQDRLSACSFHAPKKPIKTRSRIEGEKEIKTSDIPVIHSELEKPIKYTPRKPKSLFDMSVPDLLKEAEKVFNAAVRRKGISHDGTFRCISCDQYKSKKVAQCGHYMPVVYSELRFNELNTHVECITCNCIDKDHLVGYRKNLINKIGLEKVLWLESHKLSRNYKWDRQELIDIIVKYKKHA